MKQNKIISKTVEQYDGDWPPEDAVGFLAWFQNKLNAIPAEHRDGARIELGSTTSYDSHYVTIEVYFSRKETDEEESQREQQAAAQTKRRRADELRTLAALKAKYDKPGE